MNLEQLNAVLNASGFLHVGHLPHEKASAFVNLVSGGLWKGVFLDRPSGLGRFWASYDPAWFRVPGAQKPVQLRSDMLLSRSLVDSTPAGEVANLFVDVARQHLTHDVTMLAFEGDTEFEGDDPFAVLMRAMDGVPKRMAGRRCTAEVKVADIRFEVEEAAGDYRGYLYFAIALVCEPRK